jgi:GxxExxY protein
MIWSRRTGIVSIGAGRLLLSRDESGGMMLRESELTYRIRGCVFEVQKELGYGFLEKVYERALWRELTLQGISVEAQVSMPVDYKGEKVGEYFADLLVEKRVVVELKAVSKLGKDAEAQLLNYLAAGGVEVGLLVNFTYPRAEIRRFVR